MDDLISRSALLKNLWEWRLQECPVGVCDEETETYKTICECIKAVEELPTVDEKEIIRKTVKRIIRRLEKHKSDWNDDYNVPINNAIEIVKKVGGLK